MTKSLKVQRIPIDKINILNPRTRKRSKFQTIVEHIDEKGLLIPIKVSVRSEKKNDDQYDLVCGQGRLEAAKQLGASAIEAFVVDIPRENRLLESLSENIARRNQTSMELVTHIKILKDRGYKTQEIARKISIHRSTVSGILRLLRNGEEGLLKEVDRGRLSVYMAVKIAETTDDIELQKILSDSYKEGKLNGRSLLETKRIIEQRRRCGKSLTGDRKANADRSGADRIIKAYNEEAVRQKALVKKARTCESHLIFIVNALKNLFEDSHFLLILKEENIGDLPKTVSERIEG